MIWAAIAFIFVFAFFILMLIGTIWRAWTEKSKKYDEIKGSIDALTEQAVKIKEVFERIHGKIENEEAPEGDDNEEPMEAILKGVVKVAVELNGKPLPEADFSRFGGDFKLKDGDKVLDLTGLAVYQVKDDNGKFDCEKVEDVALGEVRYDETGQRLLLYYKNGWIDVTERFLMGFGLENCSEKMTYGHEGKGVEISSSFDQEGRYVDVDDFIKYVMKKVEKGQQNG